VVIDRKKADPLDAESAYDVVFDTPAVHSYGRCANLLRAGGAYVTTEPNAALMLGMVRAAQKAIPTRGSMESETFFLLKVDQGWIIMGE